MKKKLLSLMFLLCALIVGSGSAWADDERVTFPTSTSNSTLTLPYEVSGTTNVTVTINKNSGTSAATNTDGLRVYAGSTIAFSSTSKKIASIEFSYKRNKKQTNGVTANTGDFTTAFTVGNSTASDLSATWKASDDITSSVTFTLGSGSGNYALQSALVTFVSGDSNTPSISASDMDIAYNATSGSISYTVENEVTGGSLSASTTSDWLTPGTATSSTVPFTCTANPNNSERSAIVTLTYTYNTNETVTKDVTVTQALNPDALGAVNNPYTVAQAREAIDDGENGTGVTEVYATGIVSEIVTEYSSTYHNITYNISADGLTTSDQLQAFRGKGVNTANFMSASDILVGDAVIIKGNLTKHSDTYEFAAENALVALTRITAENVTIDADATSGETTCVLTLVGSASGSISTSTTANWISNITIANDKLTFTATEYENTESNRQANITLTCGDATKVITVTQNKAVAKYAVTFVSNPTGGTLTVKRNAEAITSDTEVPSGTEITIEATPADRYDFDKWQYNIGNGWIDGTGTTYTVTSAVQIRALFVAKTYYNVTFSVNGTDTPVEYEAGQAIEFNTPTAAEIPVGYVFVGWSESEVSPTDNEPTLVTSADASAPITYYAVFAKEEGDLTTATLTESEITANFTNAAMAYNNDEKTYTDSGDGVTWVAKGNASKDVKWIQIRNNDTPSYIKVSASANIISVQLTISNATNSSGGQNDITKHGKFVGTVYLETSAQGTTHTSNIGSTTATGNEDSNDITILPTSSSKDVYIQTSNPMRIWGAEVTYGSVTRSDYRTSVETATITMAQACKDDIWYYATYSNSRAFVVPDDIIVSEVGIDANGKLNVQSYTTGAVVPANTGVLISAVDYDTPYTLTYSNETGTSKLGDDNRLRPSGNGGIDADAMAATDANCLYYRLSVHEGDAGFYYGAADGAAFDVKANKAYLAVPMSGVNVKGFSLSDLMDAIKSVTTEKQQTSEAYNLMGQRVQRTQKGIVIVNGKKYYNK